MRFTVVAVVRCGGWYWPGCGSGTVGGSSGRFGQRAHEQAPGAGGRRGQRALLLHNGVWRGRPKRPKLGYTLDFKAPAKFDAGLQNPIITAEVNDKPAGALIVPDSDTASAGPMQTTEERRHEDRRGRHVPEGHLDRAVVHFVGQHPGRASWPPTTLGKLVNASPVRCWRWTPWPAPPPRISEHRVSPPRSRPSTRISSC